MNSKEIGKRVRCNWRFDVQNAQRIQKGFKGLFALFDTNSNTKYFGSIAALN